MNRTFLGIIFLAAGILLAISKDAFIAMNEIVVSSAVFINGIFILAASRRILQEKLYRTMMLIRGLMSIITGLAVAAAILVLGIDSELTVVQAGALVLSAYFVVSAGIQVFGIIRLKVNKISVFAPLVEVFISLVLAGIFFMFSFHEIAVSIVKFSGFMLIVAGVIMLVISWKSNASRREEKAGEDSMNEPGMPKIEDLDQAKCDQ